MHLENEILEQPHVIQRLIEQRGAIEQIAAAINAFQPAFVAIAARGTSDNAARYAQYAFGINLRLPVMLSTPSVHTLYETQPDLSRALVIGVSQSGRAEDVRQVITDARAQGAITLTITNDAASPLAQAAHHHIYLDAGEEISIAATKTYTAQVTALALLTAALAPHASDLFADLAQLPQWVSQTLDYSADIAAWVQRYTFIEHCIAVGRGYNFCTAFEINLKIKELCYIIGHGYSEADFRHGPIAIIQRGFPVIAVAPTGKTYAGMVDLLTKLREKQAECIVISDADEALALGMSSVRLPRGVPEWLTPIVAVIPGQVLAMRLALAKGFEVDKPRSLSKVTVTR